MIRPPGAPAASTLLKTTSSRCPVCLETVPAEVHERDGRVVMVKACPAHGGCEVTLARDPRFYHLARGRRATADCGAGSCGCAPAREERDPFDVLSTCVALIEIVDSCNLACPTCYAASPHGSGEDVDCITFEQFVSRVQGVTDRKGFIDILQLSGGEPTIHPEFFRILEWALARDEIGYVLINTNLVRFARDARFRERLAALRSRHRKFELYAQFDGPQPDGQIELRGADLRDTRRRAIDLADELDVPTTLVMVVTPVTIAHLGEAFRFGLEHRSCRGLALQPMFASGRVPRVESSLPIAAVPPISVGDVILNLVEQAPDLLGVDDFTPLPCGDPNCHTIGYVLRTEAGPVGLSRLIDLDSVQGFLRDRLDYSLDDLARCGCETEPLGELLKEIQIGPEQPFRIFIKPFMDAGTFDQDRIDRCCTHVIRPDGTLDSFCRYYLHGGAPNPGMIRGTSHVYAALTIVGILITAYLWGRVIGKGREHDGRLTVVYFCGLFGALVGAKIGFLLAEGVAYRGDWVALATGRSITGALLGGYAAVEIGKKIVAYPRVTGDAFALIVPVALIIGRVGCLFAGCCPGVACEPTWWTIADEAGVARWPAAPVELLFNVVFMAWALLAARFRWQTGNRFHVYLIAYGLFRFGHEFLRDDQRLVGPVGGYHVIALLLVAFGAWRYVGRRRHAPAGPAPSPSS